MSDLQNAVAAIIIINELLSSDEEEEEMKLRRKRKGDNTKFLNEQEFLTDNLMKEWREAEPTDYRNYLSLDEDIFAKLLNLVKNKIKKENTVMRQAISAEVRLAITLKYLQAGISFADLKDLTAVSAQSIGNVVIETCDAINEALQSYIKVPKTSAEWTVEANKFYEEVKLPFCLGALGGKHIKIKKPPHSGCDYFNYKKSFSIIIMAIANANSEFLMVDVDANGRISDDSVLSNSDFFQSMKSGQLGLPEPTPLFGESPVPYAFVSDDSFPFNPSIMRPYAYNLLSSSQALFDQTIGEAREKVEIAFQILSARFRILHTTIALVPDKAKKVILSCCYLHNFLMKEFNASLNTEDIPENSLLNLEPTFDMNSPTKAVTVRNSSCEALYNWKSS